MQILEPIRDIAGGHTVETEFADPFRQSGPALERQVDCFFANPLARLLMETVGGYLLVLNGQRQILAANSDLLKALDQEEGQALVGLRPGEAFHCIHAEESASGCGTARHCAHCGAVLSLLAAQANMEVTDGECRILMRRDGKLVAAEFQVRVTPLERDGETFLAMVLLDVSDQKRKEVFERLFFHDLVNTIQCLEGWSGRLEAGLRDPARASTVLVSLIQRLTGQVKQHRLLMQAERGELQLNFCPVETSEILLSLRQQFHMHDLARLRHLDIIPPVEDSALITDRELLQRVLSNMIVNALEATPEGGTVRVWHALSEGRPSFHVHNPGVIPPEIALQIFHRSFSTKGGYGRGLGTYGMKLLGEDHLGGSIAFHSTEAEGTRFSITLPRNPPRKTSSKAPLQPGLDA